MIGQQKLQTLLRNLGFARLPQTILLVGKKGCGKHTLAKELAKFYKVDLIDLTDNIDLNTLMKVNDRLIRTFYTIDLDLIDEKRQNVILKFLEEPTPTTYIILFSSDTRFVIDTVLGRCTKYEFEKYTRDQLKSFLQSDDERPLDLCETPGQIMTFNKYTVDDLYKLCDNIVLNLSKASIGSTFGIEDKINFSDDYDKLDFDIFLNTLENRLLYYYELKQGDLEYIYEAMNLLAEVKNLTRDVRLDRKFLLKSYLLAIWEISRGIK